MLTTVAVLFIPLLITVFAGSPPGIVTMPSGVLLEAENFTPADHWKVQSELPGFSGGGYLVNQGRSMILTTSPGCKATVPNAGKYAVWVRAFIGGKPDSGFHDREFSIEINGTRLPSTHLGVEGNSFEWELAGMVEIGEDKLAGIRLYDVGRAEAIIDCFLLTDDPQFRVPGWTGNSSRSGQGPFFKLPHAVVTRAGPFKLPSAQRKHVEKNTVSTHAYRVTVNGTLDEFNTARYVDEHGYCLRLDSGFQPNEYLIMENVGQQDVINPRIVVGGRRDWYSAETMLASILKPGMTDAEKALVIFGLLCSIEVRAHENNRRVGPIYPDDRSNPSRNSFKERGDPVRAVNSYYCSGCQYGSATFAVLARYAGLTSRCVWICPYDQYENHCVAEVFYENRWHLFDTESRTFYLEEDNTTIASYESLHLRPELVARTQGGGFAAKATKKSDGAGYRKYYPPPIMPIDCWTSTMAMTLRPGEKLIWRWTHDGKFRCGQNSRNSNLEPYSLANGKLIYQPDLKSPLARRGILAEKNIRTTVEDGQTSAVHAHVSNLVSSITYKMTTPYPIVGGVVGGSFFRKDSKDSLRIMLSIDDSDWTEIWSAEDSDKAHFERFLAVDNVLGGKFEPERHVCYVKYEFQAARSPADVGIEGVYLEFDVQMSTTSLPSLAAGDNEIVYYDETPGEHKVQIMHGWHESSVNRPPSAPDRPVIPSNHATVQITSLEKLSWSASEISEGDTISDHRVQVSSREDFAYPVSPNFDRLTFSDKQEWPVPAGWLVPGRTYYWRVRAKNTHGVWSPWSKTWQFTVAR
ncbi:MAG: hypothetical protein PHR77_01890 [Kiritimatiellae bacterium]|nr:hypothetical protein [Kiritimatiellia bacterium]MDD5519390.1 hypothetical protein [Kiritimatiellia bacterium]